MIWDICTRCLQVAIDGNSKFAMKCPGCKTLFVKEEEVSSDNKDRDRNQE